MRRVINRRATVEGTPRRRTTAGEAAVVAAAYAFCGVLVPVVGRDGDSAGRGSRGQSMRGSLRGVLVATSLQGEWLRCDWGRVGWLVWVVLKESMDDIEW